MICSVNIEPKYFQQICSGDKTVEGRVAKEKFAALRVGQCLEFVSEGKRIHTQILEIKKFKNFQQLLQYFGLKNCLPDVDSLGEALALYRSFPGYEAQETTLGVIGIKIQLLPPKGGPL